MVLISTWDYSLFVNDKRKEKTAFGRSKIMPYFEYSLIPGQ